MKHSDLDKQLAAYYREVRRGLLCTRKMKESTLLALRSSVEDYLQANPTAAFRDVVAHFGTPTEIADTALASLTPAELRRCTRSLHLLRSILVLFVTAFFFWGVCTLALSLLAPLAAGHAAPATKEVFQMTFSTLIWLGMCILFVVLEAATVGLICIWFAAGALVALLLSLVVDDLLVQVAVFAAVSFLALFVTRPLVKKYIVKAQPTNADMNVGRKALVIRAIDPNLPGRVRLDGVDWAARADVAIPEGEWCVVTSVESATLLVQPETVPATV